MGTEQIFKAVIQCLNGIRDLTGLHLVICEDFPNRTKLASVISNATWGFHVAASDIDFEQDEVLKPDASLDDYMQRIGSRSAVSANHKLASVFIGTKWNTKSA